jgi:beta-aspartyl-peptidase (threonine type)
MDAVGGDAGVIAINRQGRIGWSHRGTHLAVAFAAVGMDGPAVWLSKDYQRPAANGESLRRSSEQGQ